MDVAGPLIEALEDADTSAVRRQQLLSHVVGKLCDGSVWPADIGGVLKLLHYIVQTENAVLDALEDDTVGIPSKNPRVWMLQSMLPLFMGEDCALYVEDLRTLTMLLLTVMAAKDQQALRFLFLELGCTAQLIGEVAGALEGGLVGPIHVAMVDPRRAETADCQITPPIVVPISSHQMAVSLLTGIFQLLHHVVVSSRHVISDLAPPLWHTLLCRWRGEGGVLSCGGTSDNAAASLLSALLKEAPVPTGIAHPLSELLRQAVHRHSAGAATLSPAMLAELLTLAVPPLSGSEHGRHGANGGHGGVFRLSTLLHLLSTLDPHVQQAVVLGTAAEFSAARTRGRDAGGVLAQSVCTVARQLVAMIGRVEDAPLIKAIRAVAAFERNSRAALREGADPRTKEGIATEPPQPEGGSSKRRRVDTLFESTESEVLRTVDAATTAVVSGRATIDALTRALQAQRVYFGVLVAMPHGHDRVWAAIAQSWGFCLDLFASGGAGGHELFERLIPVVRGCVQAAAGSSSNPDPASASASPLLAEAMAVGALLWMHVPKFRNHASDLRAVWETTASLCRCTDSLLAKRNQILPLVKDRLFVACIELVVAAAEAAPGYTQLAHAIVAKSLTHERSLVAYAAVQATPQLIKLLPHEAPGLVAGLQTLLGSKRHDPVALSQAVADQLGAIVRAAHPTGAAPLLGLESLREIVDLLAGHEAVAVRKACARGIKDIFDCAPFDPESSRDGSNAQPTEFLSLLQDPDDPWVRSFMARALRGLVARLNEEQQTDVVKYLGGCSWGEDKEGLIETLGVIGAVVQRGNEHDVLLTLLEGVVDRRGRAQIGAIAAIRRIAEDRGVGVPTLFEPHEHDVAMYILGRLAEDTEEQDAHWLPLLESLLERSVSDKGKDKKERSFLKRTLKFTMPHIVIHQNTTQLTALCKVLGTEPKLIVVSNFEHIIKHIVMFAQMDDYDPSVTYIVKTASMRLDTLMEYAGQRIVQHLFLDIGAAIDECDPVDLEDTLTRFSSGLRYLADRTATSRDGHSDNITDFLGRHLLAIFTKLNDPLLRKGASDVSPKRQALETLIFLVGYLSKEQLAMIRPKAIAVLQHITKEVADARLATVVCRAWLTFLKAVDDIVLRQVLSQVAVALLPLLDIVPEPASEAYRYLIVEKRTELHKHFCEIYHLPEIPQLADVNAVIAAETRTVDGKSPLEDDLIDPILDRGIGNESLVVQHQAVRRLQSILVSNRVAVLKAEIDTDSSEARVISRMLFKFLDCLRVADSETQLCVATCLGEIGAVDHGKLDVSHESGRTLEFDVENELLDLATGAKIVGKLLYRALLSAETVVSQDCAAYAIQNCFEAYGCRAKKDDEGRVVGGAHLTVQRKLSDLIDDQSIWKVLAPYLQSDYQITRNKKKKARSVDPSPIILRPGITFKSWLKQWVGDLVRALEAELSTSTNKRKIQSASTMQMFAGCTIIPEENSAYVDLIGYLLPRLIRILICCGNSEATDAIYEEIVAVLSLASATDGLAVSMDIAQLATQTVFNAFDYLTHWKRHAQKNNARSPTNRRHFDPEVTEHFERVDNFLSRMDSHQMARAAYACRDFPRALLNLEGYIRATFPATTVQSQHRDPAAEQAYILLQQIFNELGDIDSMAGLSKKRTYTTLDEKILDHRASGEWTHALSCYEKAAQSRPDHLPYHEGLLQCQMELGHLETAITHATGTIARHGVWADKLNGYRVEASWRLANWRSLDRFLNEPETGSVEGMESSPRFENLIGEIVRSIHCGEMGSVASALRRTREDVLRRLVTISTEFGTYERSYQHVLQLHMLRDIEHVLQLSETAKGSEEGSAMGGLPFVAEGVRTQLLAGQSEWSTRLAITPAKVHVREPLLALRRCLLSVVRDAAPEARDREDFDRTIGSCWLASAKLARDEGLLQAAYSATLKAAEFNPPKLAVEEAQLLWAEGHHHEALMKLQDDYLNQVPAELRKEREYGEAALIAVDWMRETARFTSEKVVREFKDITARHPKWEKGYYKLAVYYEEMLEIEQARVGSDQQYLKHIVENYFQCLRYGSTYIFQALPRSMTIWLDYGAKVGSGNSTMKELNDVVKKYTAELDIWQFLTVLPQLCSRICHTNRHVYAQIEGLLIKLLLSHEQQALWMLVAVYKSTQEERRKRCSDLFDKAKRKRSRLAEHIEALCDLADQLCNVCNRQVDKATELKLSAAFPALKSLARKNKIRNVLIPHTRAITIALPNSTSDSTIRKHKPFPADLACFADFDEHVLVLGSLQQPKRVIIRGSDGKKYPFLCKPKDDLRKDCRVMEFFSMINKLLKRSAESRRRNLRIRTYAVLPLNEECGILEWVDNTHPFRGILRTIYEAKNLTVRRQELKQIYKNSGKNRKPSDRAMFLEILIPKHPPVFHEWFLKEFPDPAKWYSARQAYVRSAAVMSMVGYVLGLGDRHCENILYDSTSGETCHVDFNCLFNKGERFKTPERVPFRLTHNMVNAMGTNGYEGGYRRACEVTMAVMRKEADPLVAVLSTFIYDPLVEWGSRESKGENKDGVETLEQVKSRLQGFSKKKRGLPLSVAGQVNALIEEATSPDNLCAMYAGWAPFM